MEIKLINVTKNYKSSEENYIQALQIINMDINERSYISFVGPSGSGKSTLLNIIAGNIRPTTGDIYWGRKALSKTGNSIICAERRKKFGIVFQDIRLITDMNIEENILMPLVINSIDTDSKKSYLETLLERLRIKDLRYRMPEQLSGGELRKVSVARALINSPEVLIADEPTSNLDERSAHEVFSILYNLNQMGLTIVVATHDDRFSEYAEETYYLEKGSIVKFTRKEQPVTQ